MAGGEGSPEGSPAVQGGNEGEFGSNEGRDGSVREQDRFLPIANISRIMKKALPANAKIAKDAKETVQECVSEFISFITSEASDKCQREKRKTINGDDLLWSMSTLGFEDYVEPLKIYLRKYRETEGEKANLAKQGGEGGASQPSGAQGVKKEGPGGGMQGGPPPAMGGGYMGQMGSGSSTGYQQ
mmetsp:Transcript_11669/g.37047  ORF Transcript_11669/g.37047 Transcript_11669/m.37047 type:complete len:185 (-) Transcript_11669:827-1381(-)